MKQPLFFMQYLYEGLLKYRQTMIATVNIDQQIAKDVALYLQLSLTEAQHRMRQHPKYYAPYYWAGFIMLD
ncbi:MAG: CHAT domain-containing protein [Paludibacteraceae bacterium]|nr:CHAT domain-containing protein [Paludibacteraceae bacterium]MBR4563603.1 CHAT domain-containing protein [Paludibacteraceae bacterium]